MPANDPAQPIPPTRRRNVYDATMQAMHEGTTDARLDALGEKIDALGSRMDEKIDDLAKRLDGKIDDLGHRMDDRFEQVDMRFEQVDKRLEVVEERSFRLFLAVLGSYAVIIAALLGVIATGP
jgi:uncharacterized ParB-like nuclease family protein